MSKISIVGLGPGEYSLISQGALDALHSSCRIYLRTEKHPIVNKLKETIKYTSLDYFYDSEENFEDVYYKISKHIVELAKEGDLVYAVPGHPRVAEKTVGIIESMAKENNIEIIDATCPVVLQLQQKIKRSYEETDPDTGQIVIYGKRGHAEVNGLVGQTHGEAVVIESLDDFSRIDFNKQISLYSQTTKSVDGFKKIVEEITLRQSSGQKLLYYDTICRQVANRIPNIREFARQHDLILFVCGKKSSNGKVLFEECCKVNPESKLVSDISEINTGWFKEKSSIGICGATSTPKWLMEEVQDFIQKNI